MASSPTAGAAPAESSTSGEIVPDVEHAAAGTSGGGSPEVVTLFYVESALRLLLLSTSLAALLVLVTSTQTEEVPVFAGAFSSSPYFVSRTAEFQQAPALRYLLAALAVTCFYSVFTLHSVQATRNSSTPTSLRLRFHLVIIDALMAGVLAAATGAGGAIAHLGLKGNDHAGWNKICDIYDTFCRHIAGAVVVSLFGSVALVALVGLSAYSLYRCSR